MILASLRPGFFFLTCRRGRPRPCPLPKTCTGEDARAYTAVRELRRLDSFRQNFPCVDSADFLQRLRPFGWPSFFVLRRQIQPASKVCKWLRKTAFSSQAGGQPKARRLAISSLGRKLVLHAMPPRSKLRSRRQWPMLLRMRPILRRSAPTNN
jgi:hypothetical protein